MGKYKPILDFIEKTFVPGSYIYTKYIHDQLLKADTLKFIQEIIDKSNKTPSEAVFVFLAAIRFVYNDIYVFNKLEETDSFCDFVNNNYKNILEISIDKKVQGNAPERGLPILEILGKKLPNKKVAVIELGASFGLIGCCLLNPEIMLGNENLYFKDGQRIPQNPKKIGYYLGVDLEPPTKEWLFACYSNTIDIIRVKSFINDIKFENNFQLIKGSAFGFSNLKEVIDVVNKDYKIVILTSFMLYQLELEMQNKLSNEIIEFIKKVNGHWIRQEVEFPVGQPDAVFHIDWDEERIVNLDNDKCGNWEWI